MRRLKTATFLGAAILTLVFGAGSAFATHVDPILYEGNPGCTEGGPQGEDLGFEYGVKFDPPPATGDTETQDAGNPPGYITVTTTSAGVFTWWSNLEILAVIVKGGDNANVYFYNPPTTFTDAGLHAPQGYSHIEFCFDDPNVPQGEPLGVEKDAAGTSELKYTWNIDKAVVGDSTQVAMPPGTVTFSYTVTVDHDGGVEGGYEVSGTITVENVNPYDVTGVTITDELDDGTVCSVTGGINATIPASDSADFDYTCAPADDSATENTVTVAWPDQAGPPFLPGDDASFSAAVSWTQDVVDDCIDLTDSIYGDLGTVCEDAAPAVFPYDLTFDIPEFGCEDHTNTASFVTNTTGTPGSDSVTVTVCSDFDGCTPGYWKQSQHFDSWTAPYDPTDLVSSVFTGSSYGSSTLLQALNFEGGNGVLGAQRILLRSAVAALLNAASPDVDYPMTTAEVIADVNAALASGNRGTMLSLAADLDEANNAGCTLN